MDTKRWQLFLGVIERAAETQQLDGVMRLLLTVEEQEQLADRTLLLQALLEGKQTQREMAKTLNISIAKITRGSNMLKVTDNDLKQQLAAWLSEQK